MKIERFDLKVASYIKELKSVALHFTKDVDNADDLVQETLLKALRFNNKFEEGTNLKGWLFIIMRNCFISGYRKDIKISSLRRSTEEILSSELLINAGYNDGEGRFIMEDIKAAFSHLPKSLSFPFIRYIQGFKYREIARELDIPIGTVKNQIFQARKELKRRLLDYG